MGLDASKMIVLEAREGHLVLPYVHVLESAFCKPGFPCAATITLIQNCWNVVGRVGYTQPKFHAVGIFRVSCVSHWVVSNGSKVVPYTALTETNMTSQDIVRLARL
jgi:hypothetical protein